MLSKLIILILSISAVEVSFADIPTHGETMKTYSYSGPKAQAKYTAITGKVIPGNTSGWTGEAQAFKVERAQDGLTQTVCSIKYNFRNESAPKTFDCVFTKSLNGQPVPKFVPPPRRLG